MAYYNFEPCYPVTQDGVSPCRAVNSTISCGTVTQIQNVTFRNDNDAYNQGILTVILGPNNGQLNPSFFNFGPEIQAQPYIHLDIVNWVLGLCTWSQQPLPKRSNKMSRSSVKRVFLGGFVGFVSTFHLCFRVLSCQLKSSYGRPLFTMGSCQWSRFRSSTVGKQLLCPNPAPSNNVYPTSFLEFFFIVLNIFKMKIKDGSKSRSSRFAVIAVHRSANLFFT